MSKKYEDWEDGITDYSEMSQEEYEKSFDDVEIVGKENHAKEAMNNMKQSIEEFKDSIPKSEFEELTNTEGGTSENHYQSVLLEKVKHNNSTLKIITVSNFFFIIGVIAMIVSFFIKILATIYDINFHAPNAQEMITENGVIFFGVLGAIIAMGLTHLPADGLINDKWEKVNRQLLVVLFVVGLGMTIYLDNRAISNYNEKITELSKLNKMKSNSSSEGVIVNSIDTITNNILSDMQEANKTKVTINDRLATIATKKDEIQSDISKTKKAKEQKGISKKEIRKLNSNIYTSRKQLKGYDEEETRLLARLDKIEKKMTSKQKELINNSSNKSKIIDNLDIEKEKEKRERILFAWVFVGLFEVASYFTILSALLENNNLSKKITKEKRDKINNIIDAGKVNQYHLSQLEYQLLRQQEVDNAIGRARLQMTSHAGTANLAIQQQAHEDIVNSIIVASKEVRKIGHSSISKHVKYLGHQMEKSNIAIESYFFNKETPKAFVINAVGSIGAGKYGVNEIIKAYIKLANIENPKRVIKYLKEMGADRVQLYLSGERFTTLYLKKFEGFLNENIGL